MYWVYCGISDSFVATRPYSKIIIGKYGGDVDRFLIENFPELFWKKLGYGWTTIADDNHFNQIIKDVFFDRRIVLTIEEIYNLYRLVKQTEIIEGDIAEVGIYKGGSAKVICEVKGKRTLHLFDTFEGIPSVREGIDLIQKGRFADTSVESVKQYLSDYKNVLIYQGVFPDTAKHIMDCSFSFVNLDVDTYKSTLDCLNFFYPRMKKGAIILSHDYRNRNAPGVKKAFDEFIIDKIETIIELWTTQCLIVKN